MSYIQTTLTPDETVRYTAKLSQWYFLPFCIYGVFFIWLGLFFIEEKILLIALGFFVCGLIIFSWVAVQFMSTEIAVTNKRVLCKIGFISRNTTEIALGKVESVDVDQGIIGRIMGYGSVRVFGTGTNMALMKGIDDPLNFRAAVMEAIAP